MSTHVLLVDAVGLLLALTGFLLAFRQKLVRDWYDRRLARRDLPPLARPAPGDPEDPVRYALLIFGTMVMAFGIILVGFTTMFALST